MQVDKTTPVQNKVDPRQTSLPGTRSTRKNKNITTRVDQKFNAQLDKKTSETPGRTETIQPGETKQHQ